MESEPKFILFSLCISKIQRFALLPSRYHGDCLMFILHAREPLSRVSYKFRIKIDFTKDGGDS